MDIITANQFPTDLPWLEICIFFGSIVLVVSVFNHVVLNPDAERPIHFQIPVPEQCNPQWRGKVLEEPSIKVSQFIFSRIIVDGENMPMG